MFSIILVSTLTTFSDYHNEMNEPYKEPLIGNYFQQLVGSRAGVFSEISSIDQPSAGAWGSRLSKVP